MARPTRPDRNDLRAVRPLGVRPTNGRGTAAAGDIDPLGPLPLDFGRPEVQKTTNDQGHATVSFLFTCPYMDQVKAGDLKRLKTLFEEMRMTAIALSKGPYTLKALAAMGHPYATAPSTHEAVRKLRRSGHNVPRFQPGKAIGHIKGISGSVGTLSVANIQSGHFAESWITGIEVVGAFIVASLANIAEYAAYLMEGTTKMIAHGPWDQIVKLYEARLVGVWAEIVTTAASRAAKGQRKPVKLSAVA